MKLSKGDTYGAKAMCPTRKVSILKRFPRNETKMKKHSLGKQSMEAETFDLPLTSSTY